MPDWLAEGRVWGITCQLYGLRSARNWGIGDFEDLAELGELAASAGADFLGVNPLHALFLADPSRYSPYSPSSRQFLNPLYISVDGLGPAAMGVDAAALHAARTTELVDYVQVARLKRRAFEAGYQDFCVSNRHWGNEATGEFEAFCAKRGTSLRRFALYEALSDDLAAKGYHCAWHGWPEPYRSLDSPVVRRFEREQARRIAFHMWLQWVAERQLRRAQDRTIAAGMRIGLYLDLAVGVAPDGADTWSQPGNVVTEARIGCPPDMFNDSGQDWGLAPLSPTALSASDLEPFEAMLAELMGTAGAVRIDHAMGLMRLYLIPADAHATDGAYLRYPMREMLRRLAQISRQRSTIVIGEDLGTVPSGFRAVMSAAEIQGYRILYFEREDNGWFRSPRAYAHRALACLSTHDLPTLKGWWRGSDVDERERLGGYSPESATHMRAARAQDRVLFLAALKHEGVLPSSLEGVLNGTSPCPEELPAEACLAAHALLAKASSRLVAVQLEDLAGVKEQANLPGTANEHPNWRRKLPTNLKDIAKTELFRDVTRVVSRERPRPQ
jgi:4-alpha-glucanotransferase